MSPLAPPLDGLSRLRFRWCAVALLLVSLSPLRLAAQGPDLRLRSSIHPETSSAAEALLKTAASHVRQEQWESAVELYQRAIQQFPDALTSLSPSDLEPAADPPREPEEVAVFVNVSGYAQQRLAELPQEALKFYRNRVDGEARHLFEQGRDQLDPEPLRRVIDTFFCSSWGDDATELLADLSFQNGRFDEALALYRRLAPGPGDAARPSVYPDPDIDVARVAAKAILCTEALGRRSDETDLQWFSESFPEAEGNLAGRSGPYAELLASVIAEDSLGPSEALDARWPTFAGDPSRNKSIPEPVDPGALLWTIPLRASFDTASNLNATPSRFGADFGVPEDDSPAFFPVIQGDEVVLTDGRMIQAYALEVGSEGGRPVPPPSWRAVMPHRLPSASRPSFGIERHSLSVVGPRIYARLGPFGTEFQGRNNATAPTTSIIAIDRQISDAPLWIRTADQVIAHPDQPNAGALAGQVAFGGAPLADEHGVYVALLKPGTQALTWIACLDPDSGQTRWVRYICAGTSQTFARGIGGRNRGLIFNPDLGHRLLSLSGSTLFYQTDLGALASVDARSGRLNWLATYPRDLEAPRSVLESINHNPAVVHGDRVIIAPEDSDRVFAFDRATGRLAWQADPGRRVAHLLGVASGKVVVTGNHVWTIDVKTGKLLSRWPEGQTLEQGYGRGLLAGGRIYWPTRDTLYILDQRTGRPVDDPPIALRETYGCGGGNLIAGDGYLLIAERDHLRVFCKPSRMLRYYQDRIAAEPENPVHYYRLARTAEALGDDSLALESLAKSLDLADPGDRVDGRRLIDAARSENFGILMKLASIALDKGAPLEAMDRLEQAVHSAPTPRDQLEAELTRVDATVASGDLAQAVDLLQGLLDRSLVRELEVQADERRSLRAELFIGDRLRGLVRSSGPELYARYDAAARELLRLGLEADDPRLLREVVRGYPASTHVPEALEAIGALEEKRRAWSEAARAYHQLLTFSDDPQDRGLALLGLARCYQALDLRPAAREAYALASTLYGARSLDSAETHPHRNGLANDPGTPREPSPGMPGRDRPSWTIPLGRLQRSDWPEGFEPLPLDPSASGEAMIEDRPVVLIQGSELMGVDPDSGEPRWTRRLDDPPIWSGIAGGRLIVASDDRIVGLEPTDGALSWEVLIEAGELAFAPPAPDRSGGGGLRKVVPRSSRFHGFRVHGDRLYLFRGDRELVCLDPMVGRPHWVYRASAIEISPHLGLGLSRVAIQLRMPNGIGVLDARDGRTLGIFPQDDATGPWRRAPFTVALDRIVIVPDGSSVVLLDLETGRSIWEAREESPLPSSPRPSPTDPFVLGDAERLLVLRGETLQRLDPVDGQVIWSTPIGRVRFGQGRESVVLGHDALFYISSTSSGLTIGAVALDHGQRLWSKPLTGHSNQTWSLALTPDCVLASRLDDGTTGDGPQEPLILNLLRRDSGDRVQRLVVEADGPGHRMVQLDRLGIRIAGASGLWRIGELELAHRNIDPSRPESGPPSRGTDQ